MRMLREYYKKLIQEAINSASVTQLKIIYNFIKHLLE